MLKNNINKTFGLLFVAVAFLLVFIIGQIPDDKLHVYFLDVGQGDSIYVRTMYNYDILIDGGPDNKVLSELGEVMPFWDRKIDLVILSHPHADHITGLIDVASRYQIGEIIATDAITTSAEYLEWLKLIKDKGIHLTLVNSINEKKIDSKTELFFLWPKYNYKDAKVDNLNNTSIVFELKQEKFSVLFTGDIEKETQQELSHGEVANRLTSGINVLKVPHHGSANFLEDFLKNVSPNLAVISVGERNKFGHPAESTLKTHKANNIEIFRTDKNGRVEIISNGQTFWTKTEK